MDIPLRVLIIEDSDRDVALEVRTLKAAGYQVTYAVAETAVEMKAALAEQAFDIVISDHGMPQFDASGALAVLMQSGLDIPFIIVSGAIGEETAVALMKAGAHDYVMKDRLARLVPAVQKELRDAESRREHKRAEEALRDSETLFRKLFEDTAVVKLIIDMDTGNIIDANEAAAVFYGWSREQLKQMKIQEINTLSPEEVKKVMEKARIKKKIHLEFRHRRADGSVRDVDVFSSNVEVKGKNLLHVIIHDITDRKRAEEELKDTLESLRRAVGVTIQVMVSVVEIRDPYTAGHQLRSANLACAIATEMGLPQDKILGLRMAGSIHDIGKLSVPAEILSKPTKLTELEFSLIKEHARKGCEILKNVESPWPLAQIVSQHHERMDGSGYPRKLKGDEILLEARIMAVADVVEAMASHRPYRSALGIDAALEEIEKNRGIFYDDAVADACLRLFREKGFKLEET